MAGVTPVPGLASSVAAGGTAVTVIPANPAGGTITNPYGATEPLYVNPIDVATLAAQGNTFALAPGQSWSVIPGQTTPTSVNATTSAHAFSSYYTVPSP